MGKVNVPPYSGAVTISPVVGSSTISFSAAAAGSSSAPAAQRPVAVMTMTNATAKVILILTMFIRSSLRRFFLRVLRSGLPLPGYSDAPQRGRARNADGQSESYSSSARRVTQRVHPGLHRARLGFFEYQFAPPWSATDGPILCPASVATHAGVDWCRLRPTGPAVGRADTWRPTGLAVGRADAWRLCATRVDGAALSTGAERSAAGCAVG